MKNKILNIENFKEIQGKFNHTYLNGVYLAMNAIKDSYLLLDGPSCAYNKLHSIAKTHDLFSDLIRQNSTHRICCTRVRANQSIVNDRSDEISRLLLRISKEKDCSAVFTCSMPMATITGIQYDLIVNETQNKTKIPLIEIPSKSLQGDWLDGYEETLISIARKINFKENLKKTNNVAIVGYMFDRNEGDHLGNLKELQRIISGLSLNLVSVWLNGGSFCELQNIEKAQTIISLPYGRRAAREIAKKTKSDLIELDLPFGIKNTKDWISAIAKKLNRAKEAKVLIEKEIQEIAPIVNLIAPDYFMGKTFSFYGDPYLTHAITNSLMELGGKIDHAIIFGTPNSNKNLTFYNTPSFQIFYEPIYGDAFNIDTSKTDLLIGNSYIFNLLQTKNNQKPYLELGYPSFYYHCLITSPFLGFKGYINFLNRIVNNLNTNYETKY